MRDRERYEKRVGSVVDGRWRVDSLLGWGSTSAVYAATHRNGHRAALKILHQSLCSDERMMDRFLREAGIANAIKHRAIVPIWDDGRTAEGCAYLVVELLEGDTLEAMRARRSGRLDLEELAPIAEELMSAIGAVHAAGVVHRDLKPQNVFLTTTGELKLLDFGTARIFDRAAGSAVSVAGMVIGTPAFMSPEQARGARAEVDAQSDVWSLGAMLFTLLSGEPVHVGKDAHARLLAAASTRARKLGDVAPSVDERVATVIDRALSYSKEERWPDVLTMRLAFREAVLAAVPTPLSLSVAPPPPMAPRGATVDERPSESEIPSVSSTQPVKRVKAGIPLPALVLGCGAMAAVVLLVAFFMAGGDDARTRAAAVALAEPVPNAAVAPPVTVAPAASFIVIEAPDLPSAAQKKASVPAAARMPAKARTERKAAEKSESAGLGPGESTSASDAERAPEPEKEAPASVPPTTTTSVSAGDAGAGTDVEGP